MQDFEPNNKMLSKVFLNISKNIESLKQEYAKAKINNLNSDEDCFELEEKLYNFIKTYFEEYFNEKMQMIKNVIKQHNEIWKKAFLMKSMPRLILEDKSYTPCDKKIIKYIYDNLLCQYFGLNFFAENNFSKDNIFNHLEPYNKTYSNFRFTYKTNDFNLILDDLLNFTQTKYLNIVKNDIEDKINYKILDEVGLTLRERQILELYIKNVKIKDIAEDFTISVDTVKTHIKNLKDKFKEKYNINNKEEIIELITKQ